MQKIAVFLDYANINAASFSSCCRVNYGELLSYLADYSEGRNLIAAYAYVPIDPRREHAMDETIADLWNDGYIVRTKVGTFAGNSYKCDFDVEMTLDISRTAYDQKPDIVVLASGDSDFIPVVLELRQKGIRVEVASFGNSLSKSLLSRCSDSISLDSLIQTESCDEDEMFDSDSSNSINIPSNCAGDQGDITVDEKDSEKEILAWL